MLLQGNRTLNPETFISQSIILYHSMMKRHNFSWPKSEKILESFYNVIINEGLLTYETCKQKKLECKYFVFLFYNGATKKNYTQVCPRILSYGPSCQLFICFLCRTQLHSEKVSHFLAKDSIFKVKWINWGVDVHSTLTVY